MIGYAPHDKANNTGIVIIITIMMKPTKSIKSHYKLELFSQIVQIIVVLQTL